MPGAPGGAGVAREPVREDAFAAKRAEEAHDFALAHGQVGAIAAFHGVDAG